MKAEEVGDEPLQFKKKFRAIKVFVDANRREGIKKIIDKYPKTDLILLDDAFQQRKVKAHKFILLTTYQNPYFKDFILPVGWLRESRKGAKRADTIIITKCPKGLMEETKTEYLKNINPLKNQQVLFSKIKYSEYIYTKLQSQKLSDLDNFILITGIADPKPLLDFLKKQNKNFEHKAYPDHHNFSDAEIKNISKLKRPILTTEKDFVRLSGKVDCELYYLPIEVDLDGHIEL
jgi:tetraacyldisaccharide 4'-kinase